MQICKNPYYHHYQPIKKPWEIWELEKMQAKDSNAPDGGYGWVVVVSAFMVMGLTAAVLKTFGLFFVEIQQHFDELASNTSWITSVAVATFHLGGR